MPGPAPGVRPSCGGPTLLPARSHYPPRPKRLLLLRAGRRALRVRCWLLEAPRPVEPASGYRERLEVSPGFERIESGWWDGGDVRRDYHVARGASGVRYWIYREHGTREWFIHGIFG